MQLSFMPFEGINGVLFKDFFSIKDNNDINWLINHGYIKRENNEISIYPIVAEVMVDKIKHDNVLLEKTYTDFHYLEYSVSNDKTSISIYDSIARKTIYWNLIDEAARRYMLGYIIISRKKSRYMAIDKVIDYIIDYYKNTSYNDNTIDNLYNIKVKRYLLYPSTDIDEAIEICRERYEKANKCGNKFWRGIWGHNLFMAERLNNNYQSISEEIKNMISILLYENEKEGEYAYAELLEMIGREYYLLLLKKLYIKQLKYGIKSRETISDKSNDISNKIQICIDKAYCYIYNYNYNYNYNRAIEVLLEAIGKYNNSGNIILSKLYKILGDVYLITDSYDSAFKAYDKAIYIIKDMDDSKDYFLYLRRDRAYYLNLSSDSENKVEKNKSRKLYNEILNLKSDDRVTRTMYAHACYNMGLIYELEQDYKKAIDYFEKADVYIHPFCFMDRLYNICLDIDSAIHAVLLYRKCNNNIQANQILKNAFNMSRKRLGKNHPYTIKCKELMQNKD